MKTTIDKLSRELKKKFGRRKFPRCNRWNKNTAEGWSVIGHCGITRAIKKAGLPISNFWSGSNPTPSSQAPTEIVIYAYKLAF